MSLANPGKRLVWTHQSLFLLLLDSDMILHNLILGEGVVCLYVQFYLYDQGTFLDLLALVFLCMCVQSWFMNGSLFQTTNNRIWRDSISIFCLQFLFPGTTEKYCFPGKTCLLLARASVKSLSTSFDDGFIGFTD